MTSAPKPAATLRAIFSMWFSIMSCTDFLKVRTVPRSTHSCGMTFQVSPAWIWVVETTAVSMGSTLRATIDCSAVTMCAPTTTGSMP